MREWFHADTCLSCDEVFAKSVLSASLRCPDCRAGVKGARIPTARFSVQVDHPDQGWLRHASAHTYDAALAIAGQIAETTQGEVRVQVLEVSYRVLWTAAPAWTDDAKSGDVDSQ